MMEKEKTKIIFILNGVYKSRCLKRIEEFIDNGYSVAAYGFSWDTNIPNISDKFNVEIIGHQSVNYSYLKRLSVIVKSLRHIYKKYKNENVLFYYFFLDVALGAKIISRRPYIYEESDIPYLNMRFGIFRKLFRYIDKSIIKMSYLTVMTSEGFVDYHFGGNKPSNVVIVPNRLNRKIISIEYKGRQTDINNLSIGFVGGVRYRSIVRFAETFVKNFPDYNFHFFGDIEPFLKEKCSGIEAKYENVRFHGVFKNPQDLPSIYSQIDLVLATYDISSVNVRYAEPNKLYEAIYFQTPIIVSKETFLSKKVESLGVGYSINALDDDEVVAFIKGLELTDIMEKKRNCEKLPIDYSISRNTHLFDYLKKHSFV